MTIEDIISNAESSKVQEKGIAPVKHEYLVPRDVQEDCNDKEIRPTIENEPTQAEVNCQDEANAEEQSGLDEPKNKRQKTRNRGQIKDRKKVMKKTFDPSKKLCNTVAIGEECKFGNECKFSHDVQEYLKTKTEDIGGRCVQFEIYGRCPYGVCCRFAKNHTREDGSQIVNEELHKNKPLYTYNNVDSETRVKLRKNQYEFPKTKVFMKVLEEEARSREGKAIAQPTKSKSESTTTTPVAETTRNGVDEDEGGAQNVDAPPTPREKRILDFRGKTYLAPLTTVGNLPFRRICKEFGVDITCSEMAMATNLLQGQISEWALLKRHVSEDFFGVQICGNRADVVGKACELICRECEKVDFIDLNMGCPVDDIFNMGCGSGLMQSQAKMGKIIRTMDAVAECPITVKFRKGVLKNKPIADKLIPKFESWGAVVGTLHGRSRQQRYTKLADWDYVSQCRELTSAMPLFGNGDVMSWEDYWEHIEKKQADGVMIGRGALIKPWIFQEIKERKVWDISSRERFDILKKFCDYGYEHWGTDERGLNNTRRFLCEWQSFLHRYIPVALLEVLPQRINDRPPPYYGRDELETLMASPQVSDWIKLTERIMGPAPEDFVFVPKHKANAYEG